MGYSMEAEGNGVRYSAPGVHYSRSGVYDSSPAPLGTGTGGATPGWPVRIQAANALSCLDSHTCRKCTDLFP
jgi:hypothetical protein